MDMETCPIDFQETTTVGKFGSVLNGGCQGKSTTKETEESIAAG